MEIVRLRLSGLGLSKSDVSVRGDDLSLTLPRGQDSQQVIGVLSATGALYFRPVYCEIPKYSPPSPTAAAQSTGTAANGEAALNLSKSQAACNSNYSAELPSTPAVDEVATAPAILPSYDGTVRYVLGPADLSGGLSDATIELDQATNQFQVLLTFTSKGSVVFDNIAATRDRCYAEDPSNPPPCSLEAIEFDGAVESAPSVQAPSFNGDAVISGSSSDPYTKAEASKLAVDLRYGSLPVRFSVESVHPSG